MRLAWIVLAGCSLAFTAAVAHPRATPSTQPKTTAAAPARIRIEALYSRRALRRARLLVQLRLMELRDRRFDCLRTAIVRSLPSELRPPIRASLTDCDKVGFPPP